MNKNNIVKFQNGKLNIIKDDEKQIYDKNKDSSVTITLHKDNLSLNTDNCSLMLLNNMIANAINSMYNDPQLINDEVESTYLKCDFIVNALEIFGIGFDELVTHIVSSNITSFMDDHFP